MVKERDKVTRAVAETLAPWNEPQRKSMTRIMVSAKPNQQCGYGRPQAGNGTGRQQVVGVRGGGERSERWWRARYEQKVREERQALQEPRMRAEGG